MKYLSKNPDSIHLFIKKTSESRNVFKVFDKDDVLVYRVNGSLFGEKKRINLKLLDGEKNRIGEIKQSLIAKRSIMFHENNPADYVITIGTDQVATVKTTMPKKGVRYEVVPQGWHVKSSAIKYELTMIDQHKNEIAHISERSGYDCRTYILDFPDGYNAELILSIMITLACREKYLSEHVSDNIGIHDMGDY